MDKGSDKRSETKNAGHRWDLKRGQYTCRDGADVSVPNRTPAPKCSDGGSDRAKDLSLLRTGIVYQPYSRDGRTCRLLASATEFDRSMSQIAGGLKGKTLTFPRTCRKMSRSPFEGAEVERVALPKTLKEIGNDAFCCCRKLKTIIVEDGCEADLSYAGIPDATKVGPPRETTIGDARVWDLRELRDVVIPEGVER